MGVRENIDRHRGLTTGITIIVIIAAAAFAVYNIMPERVSERTKAFFTIDEGKTWFVDSIVKAPPFEYKGKTAYRVEIFSCDGGKTRFAGYLLRYTPEGKQQFEAAVATARKEGRTLESILTSVSKYAELRSLEPGSPWISVNDVNKASKIRNVRCPPGVQGIPDSVLP